jgi:hypothetical protein
LPRVIFSCAASAQVRLAINPPQHWNYPYVLRPIHNNFTTLSYPPTLRRGQLARRAEASWPQSLVPPLPGQPTINPISLTPCLVQYISSGMWWHQVLLRAGRTAGGGVISRERPESGFRAVSVPMKSCFFLLHMKIVGGTSPLICIAKGGF